MRILPIAASALAGVALLATAAYADDAPASAPAAAPAAPAAPAPPAFSLGMDGPIVINPTPYVVNSGPLGSVTINGAVSGLMFAQNHHAPGDHSSIGDVPNAQLLIEKTDGMFQWFVDAGSYSFPTVGVPYTKASRNTTATFGNIPVAYVKFVPNAAFSVQVGKLPTVLGAEFNYTFENMNIQRGLLWNQENLVTRGVLANYAYGPVAVAVSVNDGFYSNALSTVSGSATWTINAANTVVAAASTNTRKSYVSNSATSPVFNDSSIYNLIYTHTDGPWTITPYVQYTSIPSLPGLGTTAGSTTGAALFVSYAFPSVSGLSLPVRLEYISSKGLAKTGPNPLGYGNGSTATSFTVTPTYQWKIYFVRGEVSYVNVSGGSGFGANGLAKSQARALLETGVLF